MKDNIMKLTDGLFHRVFDEVAKEYPDIENESWIVDIGAAKLADKPETFDVVVMPNLYGDILSDVAAQIAGSVGLAGSANIGDQCAMFEAIHGSAPRRAGQNLANPSGLLLGAVMMLVHIDQPEVAARVHNAWLRTIEDGIHTYDIYKEGVSKEKVGTKEFADAVVARLGQKPQQLKAVSYTSSPQHAASRPPTQLPVQKKELVGVDVFLDWSGESVEQLQAALRQSNDDDLALTLITNRGAMLWPHGQPETFTTDHWRCRFLATGRKSAISHQQIIALLQRISESGLDFIKTENLYTFDGQIGYSQVSGE
jgi:isocitrate dehydrogenase